MQPEYHQNSWKDEVRRSFEKGAACYTQHDEAQRRIADTLSGFLPDLEGAQILELGCGTGNLTRYLIHKYAKSSSVYITDQSEAMVDMCRDQFSDQFDNTTFSVADGEALKFEHKFDLIVSSMSAQWFSDFDAALFHQKAFLKEGGQILMAVPSSQTFKEWNESLAHLGLDSGVLDFPVIPDPVFEDVFQTQFASGFNFLRMLKIMGVSTPRPGYTALSPSDLKKAVAYFEAEYKSQISWHVQIGRYLK